MGCQREDTIAEPVMADFKTHVTTSTVLGIGYAGAGILCGARVESSLVAAGLCSVAGMLPDIDSDSGRPVRETMNFCAAVVPMLMLDRFRQCGMTNEMIALVGAGTYLMIRFGLSAILKRFSVHRGMYHSLPAALIFTELAFMVVSGESVMVRYYKAGGVLLGFMSHLVLDEIWSVSFRRGLPKLKSSFGTAIKFFGPSLGANLATYTILAATTALVLGEPAIMQQLGMPIEDDIYRTAHELLNALKR
jgi:hypothetical protein